MSLNHERGNFHKVCKISVAEKCLKFLGFALWNFLFGEACFCLCSKDTDFGVKFCICDLFSPYIKQGEQ